MTIWIEHDGGPNPVREGETLVAYRLRGGGECAGYFGGKYPLVWSHGKDLPRCDHITHYAVTPPRASITPPAPMDAAEVLVRAREAVIELGFWDYTAVDGFRAAKQDDDEYIRAILAFHRDLSRPLAEVAPHTVEDADAWEADRIAMEHGWHVSNKIRDAIKDAIKRGRELERAGKAAR